MKKNYFLLSEKALFFWGILSMIIFSACTKSVQDIAADDQATLDNSSTFVQTHAREIVPNELIIKFNGNVGQRNQTNSLALINGSIQELIFTKTMQRSGQSDGVYLVHTSMNVYDAIERLKSDASIEYAEPNYVYYHAATSNDTYFSNGSLWGMYGTSTSPANTYGSQAAVAWAAGHTGSATVYVGIIDEGAMYSHEDLEDNFGNPNETGGNGIDDDGNGFIDDNYGWDFDGNNNSTFDGTGDDHGTHVAGTIGAKGGNGIGVAGVNWNVKMISAKFLGRRGGTTANAIKAVDYFTDLKTLGLNIVATNNSWGGGGYSQALYDAIERANTAGILFIAAAGNDGNNIDATPSYPAGYTNSNIISVAALTSSGAIASYSNYGSASVDIGAPGSGIYSTLPGGRGKTITSSYGSYNGTSMATPHVSGAAALYASTHPGASASAIKSAILSSATATSSLSGKCVTGGRLNVSGF